MVAFCSSTRETWSSLDVGMVLRWERKDSEIFRRDCWHDLVMTCIQGWRGEWRHVSFPAEQDGWVPPVSEKKSWKNARYENEEQTLGTWVLGPIETSKRIPRKPLSWRFSPNFRQSQLLRLPYANKSGFKSKACILSVNNSNSIRN
jgi:hypothetical protein